MDNDGNGTVSSSSCPKRTQFALMGAFLGFKDLWLPRVAISDRWLLYVLAVFGITLGPMLIVVFGQRPLANGYGSKCLTIILVYCHYWNRQFCGSVHVPNLSRHSQYLMLKSHPNACWLKSLKILDNPFKSFWLPQSPLNSHGSFLPCCETGPVLCEATGLSVDERFGLKWLKHLHPQIDTKVGQLGGRHHLSWTYRSMFLDYKKSATHQLPQGVILMGCLPCRLQPQVYERNQDLSPGAREISRLLGWRSGHGQPRDSRPWETHNLLIFGGSHVHYGGSGGFRGRPSPGTPVIGCCHTFLSPLLLGIPPGLIMENLWTTHLELVDWQLPAKWARMYSFPLAWLCMAKDSGEHEGGKRSRGVGRKGEGQGKNDAWPMDAEDLWQSTKESEESELLGKIKLWSIGNPGESYFDGFHILSASWEENSLRCWSHFVPLRLRNGMPTNEEQWTAWFQWMKSGNLEDQTIRNFYQEMGTWAFHAVET